MSGERRLLNADEGTRIVQAAGLYVEAVRAIVGTATPPTLEEMALLGSIGVQGIVRQLVIEGGADVAATAIVSGAEGVGLVIGLVPEVEIRTSLILHATRAMASGVAANAAVHETVGGRN